MTILNIFSGSCVCRWFSDAGVLSEAVPFKPSELVLASNDEDDGEED
jgi:uncharacterized protein YodC (DUF2158 family)